MKKQKNDKAPIANKIISEIDKNMGEKGKYLLLKLLETLREKRQYQLIGN